MPIRAIPLPTRRLLDRQGQETFRFQMLVVVPPTAHQKHPARAQEVAVPVATLERVDQGRAVQAALALAYRPTNDGLAEAGRVFLLASFEPGVRAVLGLGDEVSAVPLPVIRISRFRET